MDRPKSVARVTKEVAGRAASGEACSICQVITQSGRHPGYSVASPFGVAKSGMERDFMRNTVSRRNAQGALGALPHPSMLRKDNYHRKERKEVKQNVGTRSVWQR